MIPSDTNFAYIYMSSSISYVIYTNGGFSEGDCNSAGFGQWMYDTVADVADCGYATFSVYSGNYVLKNKKANLEIYLVVFCMTVYFLLKNDFLITVKWFLRTWDFQIFFRQNYPILFIMQN